MSTERWQHVQDLFHSALALAGDERSDFIDSACADDADLHREVVSLLGAHDESERFLEESREESVARLINEGESPALVGRRMGGFKITGVIGRGGMGMVYAAMQAKPRREVALKVMRPGLASPAAARRFADESDILARLRHPSIAQIFEAGSFDDESGPMPYFAMELIPDALSVIAYSRVHDLAHRQRVELMVQACRAVHYGHQRGVIHRDLTPGNLLVDASGRVKIIDFGVARATDADIARTTAHTDVGQLVGTLPYLSPEQCLADPREIDVRSDVYTLGVVLYEILGACLPHDVAGSTVPQAMKRIMEVEPRRLGALDARLRGDLETIVAKTLEKDPELRYQSAEALADDLERHLRHEPIVARSGSTSYRLRKLARRHRGLLTAVAIVFAVLVMATVLSATFAVASHRSEQRALGDQQEASRQEAAAQASKARAERRFDELWRLSHALMFDVHDSVRDLEGSTDARHMLVEMAQTYLESLAQEAIEDERLMMELSASYQRLGDVQGGVAQGNLGDTTGALASYRRSLELLSPLAVEGADPGIDRQRSVGYLRVGDMLHRTGDPDGAIESYRKAVILRERLVDRRTEELDAKRDLAVALARLGDLLGRQGRAAEGLVQYERAHAIFQELAERRPDDPAARRDVAAFGNNVADLMARSGDTAGALERRRRSLEIYETLVAEQPDNGDLRRRLALSLTSVANSLSATGDLDAALTHHHRALEVRRVRASANPEDVLAERDLALSLTAIGNLLGNPNYPNHGDADGALELYHEALEIRRRQAEADPANVAAQRNHAIMHSKIGDILMSIEDREGGLAAYRAGNEIIEALHRAHPESSTILGSAVSSSLRMADALLAADEVEAAIDAYGESTRLSRELVERRGSADTSRQLSVVLSKAAYARLEARDFDGTIEHHLEALAIREQLHADDPTNAHDHRNLAMTCRHLGGVQEMLADADAGDGAQWAAREAAMAWFERSETLFEELRVTGRLRPSDEKYREEVIASVVRCKGLLRTTGDGGSE